MTAKKRLLFSITLLGFLVGEAERPLPANDGGHGPPWTTSVAGPLEVEAGVYVNGREYAWSFCISNHGDEPLVLNVLFGFHWPGEPERQFMTRTWWLEPRSGLCAVKVPCPLPEDVESGAGSFTITAIATSSATLKQHAVFGALPDLNGREAVRTSRGPLVARDIETFWVP